LSLLKKEGERRKGVDRTLDLSEAHDRRRERPKKMGRFPPSLSRTRRRKRGDCPPSFPSPKRGGKEKALTFILLESQKKREKEKERGKESTNSLK